MANYFQSSGVEARKRYDAKMTPGAAAAKSVGQVRQLDRPGTPHYGRGPLVRGVGQHPDPDYTTMAVREATIEYNQVKAGQRKMGEIIPALAYGSLGRTLAKDVSLNCIEASRDLMHRVRRRD